MQSLTPMLRQYYDVKSEYPGCILLFRLGDFYEMFDDDAVLASRLLEITLTSREAGKGRRIPMCGVPYHSVEGYIAQLVAAGHKVALCEQVEDPKEAKGVVRREVVRVFTPGTLLESGMLKERENNFLVAIARRDGRGSPGPGPQVRTSNGRAFRTGASAPGSLAGSTECRREISPPVSSYAPDRKGSSPFSETRSPASTPPNSSSIRPSPIPRSNGRERRSPKRVGAVIEVLPEPAPSVTASRRRLLEHFQVESLEGFGCEELDTRRCGQPPWSSDTCSRRKKAPWDRSLA